jgi:hypothetical protein
MNYAVVMATDSMIHTPSFKKVGSGIQKLLGGIHIQTHTQSKVISEPTTFFQIRKVS